MTLVQETVNIMERLPVRSQQGLTAIPYVTDVLYLNMLKASVFSNTVDVRPEDQLLLLVTCVDADEERRVVAARRVRDGETEAELKKLVERSWKKP